MPQFRHPFTRLKLLYSSHAPTPPAPPPAVGNLNNFESVKSQETYTKVTATYQAEKAKFDRDVQTTLQQDNQRIDSFIAQLKPLIEAPANCQGKDIIGGIARADLSLSDLLTVGHQ